MLISVTSFVVGALLYQFGLFAMFGSRTTEVGPWHWVTLALICALGLLRRRSSGIGLALATAVVCWDAVLGLTAPTLAAFFDHVYAATMYGSRRLSKAMVPLAALSTVGTTAIALVHTGDWKLAVLAALATNFPFVITPVWWATGMRQFRDLAEQERENAAQLARISELDRDAAVVAERSRMARDLHDVIAGHLSAIAIQSEAALSLNEADPATSRKVLEAVRENSVHALEEMRAMIGLLRSAQSDADEKTAPARLADLSVLVDSARATGMRVDVRTELDEDDPLPAAVDLTAYRIAQEALTNAVKHAPNTDAVVTVRRVSGTLHVEVTNELPPDAGDPAGTGRGLLNMRERAAAVGGSLSAGPAGSSWSVRARLPIGGGEA
ncbi:sensor histidine kinase [Amycolatopsis minnesotensis]|uniref:sensor histidine kinase n=1 Tax=Amycolatopsis minnesotensis TaxID=337894 RepID=UPI0031DFEB3A